MAIEDRDDKTTYRGVREDRTGMYVTMGAVALAVLGLLAWAASDSRNEVPQTSQTESVQPKTNTP